MGAMRLLPTQTYISKQENGTLRYPPVPKLVNRSWIFAQIELGANENYGGRRCVVRDLRIPLMMKQSQMNLHRSHGIDIAPLFAHSRSSED